MKFLPHSSSLWSSSSLLKSSLIGVVTILGMGETAAMFLSKLTSSSLSPAGKKWIKNGRKTKLIRLYTTHKQKVLN